MMMLVASLFFALFASWFLLLPFFKTVQELGDGIQGELRELSLKKEMLMNALEDLENDKLSGILAEDQYQASKKELLAETAQCLSKIDISLSELELATTQRVGK